MTILRTARNRKRALGEAEAFEILTHADHGVLATVDASGQPYAVPLNHVLAGEVLYMHGALEGHKLSNIAQQPRVSYCAIEEATVDPAILSTWYASTIVFGTAEQITGEQEKQQALEMLLTRLGAPLDEKNKNYIARMMPKTAVLALRIEEISAKAHRRD